MDINFPCDRERERDSERTANDRKIENICGDKLKWNFCCYDSWINGSSFDRLNGLGGIGSDGSKRSLVAKVSQRKTNGHWIQIDGIKYHKSSLLTYQQLLPSANVHARCSTIGFYVVCVCVTVFPLSFTFYKLASIFQLHTGQKHRRKYGQRYLRTALCEYYTWLCHIDESTCSSLSLAHSLSLLLITIER